MEYASEIVNILRFEQALSRAEIANSLTHAPSVSGLKRAIADLVARGELVAEGRGRATRYSLSVQAKTTAPIDLETYFANEIDDRKIRDSFNFTLFSEILPQVKLFTAKEREKLELAQQNFRNNLQGISETEYKKEMARLGIDLSWKSAQIEGNTYSLLETERLLNERIEAKGKTREEATMLLNHKEALGFVLDEPNYLQEISLHKIEEIHAILTKNLAIDSNIRRRRVGITGTNYQPLDNEFQIREAVETACTLVNNRADVFEKSLLALVLLSYIQPFADGNKRTARIVTNAILIANGFCPISFRTVDSLDYKKAMLVFYEQNNISAFKQIFISQFEFAAMNYF